jgi:hypothetical protein
MSTKKHYFVEQTDDLRYAVRAKGSKRATDILDTQREAIVRVDELNPNDPPRRGTSSRYRERRS